MPSLYCSSTITKKGTETDDLAAVLVTACSSWQPVDVATLSADQADATSKLRVVQFINKFNSKIVVVQSMCALLLMGKGDFFMTHLTVAYLPYSFQCALKDQVAPDLAIHMVGSKDMATAVNTGGRLAFVKPVIDYIHRHEALKPVPAYFY